jgi:hypothetical protein
MKKSVLATFISLAYPPVSNYDFTNIRDEEEVQNYIKNSRLYMISQRPKLIFDNIAIDQHENIHFEIVQETSNYRIYGILPIRQTELIRDIANEVYVEFGRYEQDFNFGEPPYHNIDGIKFYDKNMEFISWLTPERLIYEYSHSTIEVGGMAGWGELVKYNILYVGKSTDQDIWERLTGHEKLQDILSQKASLKFGTLPTHEICLLLFKIDAFENINILGNFKDFDNMEVFLNKSEINNLFKLEPILDDKSIFLDAEKAFVKCLNPEYNKVKFKSYPKSNDGLYQFELDFYSYTLRENIVLTTNELEIFGSLEDNDSDTIQIVNNEEISICKPKRRK